MNSNEIKKKFYLSFEQLHELVVMRLELIELRVQIPIVYDHFFLIKKFLCLFSF